MENGAKNTEKCEALWCELQFCRWRESHVTCHKKKWKRILSPRRTIYLSIHNHLQTSTHTIHQMSLASDTSILFHSSFNLLHMSLIKPHLHIHTTTHIPKQPSKPKHHITHLILQLFTTSSLKHLDHFIPDLFQSQSKFTLLIPQASTRLHFHTSILLIHCLTISASNLFQFLFQTVQNPIRGKIYCKKSVSIFEGFGVSIYLLEFLLISRTCSVSCLVRRSYLHEAFVADDVYV